MLGCAEYLREDIGTSGCLLGEEVGGWEQGRVKRHTFPLVLLELNHVYYLKPFYLEKSQDSSYSSTEGLLLDGRKDFLGSGRRLKRSWHSGLC